MSIPSDSVLMTSAASARAIAGLYSLTLLATILVAAAAMVVWFARRSSAQARALVLRSAVAGLLVLCLGRQAPLNWSAWIVPDLLAIPLVALGKLQVMVPSAQGVHSALDAATSTAGAPVTLRVVIAIYAIGVVVALLPLVLAVGRMRRVVSTARVVADGRRSRATTSDHRSGRSDSNWRFLINAARDTVGLRRTVRVMFSNDITVPMTWGLLRPVVLLPLSAETWSSDHRRMVLLHELTHVRSADWLFAMIARVVCALLWFHPGVWFLAAELREQSELACDERVLAAGVRRSDYADLLMTVAQRLAGRSVRVATAPALARPRGLRARLVAILDVTREARPLAASTAWLSFAVTFGIVAPMSTMQLAPTRTVLTTLMLDAKWESRAYAVIGLAQRADSVAVAENAAESDPSPRVRAWAKFALAQGPARSALIAPPADASAVIYKR